MLPPRPRLLLLALLACAGTTHAFQAAVPVPGISALRACTVSSPSSSSRSSSSSHRSSRGLSRMAATPVPISRVGFGTYRVGNSKTHAEALREALLNGVTLIDTSSTYTDGDSERTVGHVIEGLVAEGNLKREAFVLVSKFGYIQGQNHARYESGEVVTPDTVHYAPGLKHCIHPDFMRDQLTRSLGRLGLPHLDAYLLHNPEYYITHSIKKTGATEEELARHRAEMERRIFEAFKALEAEVGKGRIRSYGISSNSFSLPASHPHFLRYDNLVELAQKAAREVGGDAAKHHFSTIQLPANLVEQEGVDHAVRWAEGQGLIVLINRPLNAFDDDRQIYLRLAEYPDASGEYDRARGALLALIDERVEGGDARYGAFREQVVAVDGQLAGADNVLAWDNIAGRLIVPALRRGLEATADAEGRFDEEAMQLSQLYLEAAERDVKHRSGVAAREAVETTLGFGALPADKSLQDFSIEWLLGKPGVTCVLVGSRSSQYAKDAIKLVSAHPPVRSFEF